MEDNNYYYDEEADVYYDSEGNVYTYGPDGFECELNTWLDP